MENIKSQLSNLQKELNTVLEKVDYKKLLIDKSELDTTINKPDFWTNQSNSKKILQEQSQITKKLEPILNIQKELKEIKELVDLEDDSIIEELEQQLQTTKKRLKDLKEQLRFNGPYDERKAILSIYSGAGGTDAQDWVQILFRMYVKWAEKNKYKTKIIEESLGEEAGLKNVTLEINGLNTYGLLKGEQGVHRLVRLSPFNAANLRQTSFAKVVVLPEIDDPDDIKLNDSDLRVDYYKSSGHGGQSVNTTDSAVRITHLPTKISVSIQNERSQTQNKETAMTLLRSQLVALQLEQHQQNLELIKGPNQSAEWGNQIRSYVLHPYKMVKDLRTNYETTDIEGVLNGNIDNLIDSYLSTLKHT